MESMRLATDLPIDEDGKGTLEQPRLYQLIREPRAIRDRTVEISFLEPSVEAYALTFG